jgi:hypothetical protein
VVLRDLKTKKLMNRLERIPIGAEMEVNVNSYHGGVSNVVPTAHPGTTLVYLTPGLVLGRFNL